ncbi:MAG: FimV/HubP family polar landmark protein [Burkholderiaceae bacterium]
MKRTFPQSRRLASSVALALATLSVGGVHAAGLGRLTVQSGLGQPLRAEVEVTSLGRDESPSLSVKLASPDAFKQAGLQYSPSLSNLRLAIDRRPDGRAAVRISSAQPLNEPFVDLLIELNWATGKFVREYTFLLDPPEIKVGGDASQNTAASVVAPAVAASADGVASAGQSSDPAALAASARAGGRARSGEAPGAPALARSRDAAARPAPAQPAARAPSAGASAAAGGTVAVRQGETLAAIAARVKPSEVTMEQAIIAIYRANPSAFFGSVHQLRSGATLGVPDAGAMSAIDDKLARAEIRAQMANFNQYKARMAAAARAVEGERAGQSASGSVSGSVTDRSAPGLDSDRLKLSKSGGGAAGAGNSVAASDAEREVASEAAAREAQGRVHELEKSVADLRRLLELKDKQLADLQAAANAARAGAPAASGAAAPAVAAAGSPSTAAGSLSPSAAAADAVAAATSATQSNSPAATPSQSSSAAAPVSSGPSADAQPPAMPAASPAPAAAAAAAAAASSPAAVEPKPVAVEPKPVAAPPAVSAPAPTPEPSLFDELSDNPLALPGLAAIIALIAGSAWVAMRRRKKNEKFEDSLIAPDGLAANSLFGSTGGQTSVDTHNSLFTASRETASDVHSTEVDPIAEAEVYIAYGREAQAEEILKEALKKQPERQAIRLKLMEIYAGRKDAKLFSQVAADMHEMTGGLNEEWPKVVTLGLSLDPDNPLYAGKGAAGAVDPAPLAASFETEHAGLAAVDAEPPAADHGARRPPQA